MAERTDPSDLSSQTRILIEALLYRLGAGEGRWRVALEAQNGRLLHVDLNELRIPASSLARFDETG